MAASWSATLTDHAGVVAASPDGSLVALGSLGGDARVVEVDTGQVVVLAAAWSCDGQHLAVGGQDGVLRLYRPGGASVAAMQLDGWVTSVEWSPGGLAAVGAGQALTILEPDGTVSRRYPDQASTVTAVAWSVDGTRVGAAAYGGVSWYDPAPDLEPSGPARTFAWKGSLLSLAVSPTGKWACGGAQDATVHIWRLWSGRDLSMSGYPTKIEHLGFRHDGRWLAVGCMGDLTVWDFRGRGPAGTRPARGEGHDRHITSLAWQPTGDQVATGGADGRAIVWPSPTRPGRALQPVAVHERAAPVAAVAWAAGTLVVGHADGRVESVGDRGGV